MLSGADGVTGRKPRLPSGCAHAPAPVAVRQVTHPIEFDDVAEIVLVVTSSRGGSSLLMKALQDHCDCLTLQGECTPYLRKAGLSFPTSGSGSDSLSAAHVSAEKRRFLEATLLRDLGTACTTWEHLDVCAFKQQVGWRLSVQWPELTLQQDDINAAVDRSITLSKSDDSAGIALECLQTHLIRELAGVDPRIRTTAYDHDVITGRAAPTDEPPAEVVEEPPFVIPRPWRAASDSDLSRRSVILKSPSSAYRLEFWRRLLPDARFRILHLVRNPAASINGLYDAWLFNGFYSHRVGGLKIQGYSHLPGGREWWKLDLPPGWHDYRTAPLERICAFQWYSAHRHVLDYISRDGSTEDSYAMVNLESFVDKATRSSTLKSIAEWLGVQCDLGGVEKLPRVMATAAPRPGRWMDRQGLIESVLDDGILELARALGYSGTPARWDRQ